MKKAAATRLAILQKAFELIYTKGYQTTSIDDIIATMQVTKGAFYYHFKTKDEMGLAIISEILKPTLQSSFIAPLQNHQNPLEAIYELMENLLMKNDFLKVEYGCPASNLTQEMAPCFCYSSLMPYVWVSNNSGSSNKLLGRYWWLVLFRSALFILNIKFSVKLA